MPELLSPAGNFEKLKAAILYGADAVYCAGQMFGMRASADNFTVEELYAAAEYVHARGKKIYLTVNTMPHVREYPMLRKFLVDIKDAGIDAMIVADLGVMSTIREIIPDMEIHISTQTSIVSPASAYFFTETPMSFAQVTVLLLQGEIIAQVSLTRFCPSSDSANQSMKSAATSRCSWVVFSLLSM